MFTTSPLAFSTTPKYPQPTSTTPVAKAPVLQSQDSVTFSGKQHHDQKPKFNPKTILTLGLGALGLGGVAHAMPVDKNDHAARQLPTPTSSYVACPACTDFLPPIDPSSSATSSSSTPGPQPSARKRQLNKAQQYAKINLQQAKADFFRAQDKTDELCPDRKSHLKQECKDAKKAEMAAAKRVGQAQIAAREL